MSDSVNTPEIVTDVPRPASRPDALHKGQAGRVAIVAGSRGMTGAALLSGLGALRGGAGLVRVLTPESVLPIVATSEPCLMTVPLPSDEAGRVSSAARDVLEEEALRWADVIAVGPGLGAGEARARDLRPLLERLITEPATHLVVDADGLNNSASELHEWLARRGDKPAVITPHPGEMARLRRGAGLPDEQGQDDDTRIRVAHEYARCAQCVVVLKGHRTVVSTSQQAYVNTTGNPGMATGGMGDVLTGLIAALLGQGMSPFDAARLGVHAHGAAGDLCARQIAAYGYLARELADAVPAALAQVSRPPMGFR